MAESDWTNDFDILLDSAVDQIRARLPVALAKGAEHLRAESVKLVPIETGNLAASAEVIPGPMEAQVYYPGPYARNQHYSLWFKHTHGQALYLEQPTITEAERIFDIIADDLREAL